jgi:hypothetical protein
MRPCSKRHAEFVQGLAGEASGLGGSGLVGSDSSIVDQVRKSRQLLQETGSALKCGRAEDVPRAALQLVESHAQLVENHAQLMKRLAAAFGGATEREIAEKAEAMAGEVRAAVAALGGRELSDVGRGSTQAAELARFMLEQVFHHKVSATFPLEEPVVAKLRQGVVDFVTVADRREKYCQVILSRGRKAGYLGTDVVEAADKYTEEVRQRALIEAGAATLADIKALRERGDKERAAWKARSEKLSQRIEELKRDNAELRERTLADQDEVGGTIARLERDLRAEQAKVEAGWRAREELVRLAAGAPYDIEGLKHWLTTDELQKLAKRLKQ